MEMMYLVSYTRHNASTGGWAYKVELSTKNRDEAEKKYHALLVEFIGGDTFDFVTVMFYDSYGNDIEHKNWKKEAPAPAEAPAEKTA